MIFYWIFFCIVKFSEIGDNYMASKFYILDSFLFELSFHIGSKVDFCMDITIIEKLFTFY